MKKRYAIVRVDNNCPFVTEDMKHTESEKVFNCNEFWEDDPCSKKCKYGDTKEQLIRKVAQVMFKNAPKETYLPRHIEQKRKILKDAKEIVEFLGVEE